MPRKKDVLDRFTLRVGWGYAKKMNAVCEAENLTQREFIEDAMRAYCQTPVDRNAEPHEPEPRVYRTGMWIDPKIVKLMDKREAQEGIRQRALLERAIQHAIDVRAERA